MSALDLDALERRARKGLVLSPDETRALITRLRAAEARTGGAVTDRDPWVAIVRAAKAGRGVQLSWTEVQRMVRIDDAIRSAAEMCTTECVCDIMRGGAQCEKCEASGG